MIAPLNWSQDSQDSNSTRRQGGIMNLDDFSNGQANATRLAVGLEFRSRPSFPAGEAPAYESSADYAVAEGLRSDAIEIKIEAGSFRVLAKKAIVVMGLNVSKGSLRVRKAPGKPKRGSSYQFDAPIDDKSH